MSKKPKKIAFEFDYSPGKTFGTPKEVWGFDLPVKGRNVKEKSRKAVSTFANAFRISPDLKGIRYKTSIKSLGATHVLWRQEFRGIPIHRAYLTIHIRNSNSRAYLIKNRTIPREALKDTKPFADNSRRRNAAKQKALEFVFDEPSQKRKLRDRKSRAGFLKKHDVDENKLDVKKRWYLEGKTVRPCYRFHITCTNPRQEWFVFVDADPSYTKKESHVLAGYNNVPHARSNAEEKTGPFGYVFDPNPVRSSREAKKLLKLKADRQEKTIFKLKPSGAAIEVQLEDLKKNAKYLDGKRVTTKLTNPRICRDKAGNFCTSKKHGFGEVMVYYHINEAVKYLESLGFKDELQIFKKPIEVNTRASNTNNSFYSPWRKTLEFGTGYGVDDANDADVILHELGHAVQDAIIPSYGQTPEAESMGEGFGDYFAASYFYSKMIGKKFKAAVMTWDGFKDQSDSKLPASLRRVDHDDLTFMDFRLEREYRYKNGEIWSSTLWDIFNALGRRTADQIIIESHFEQDGFTTYSRAARAIIHADKNLNKGKNRKKLEAIFKRRKIKLS